MKVLVAIHTSRFVENETVESIFAQTYRDFDFKIFNSWGADEGKNTICKYAIDNNYDKVLFVDSDAVLNPDTLEELVASGKNFIMAWALRRQNPDSSNMFGENRQCYTKAEAESFGSSTELIRKVWCGGTHTALFDVEALKRCERPFFRFQYHANGDILASEDTGFFRFNLPKIGEEAFCDFSQKVGHVVKQII